MFTPSAFCLIFAVIACAIFSNCASAMPTDNDDADQKRSLGNLIGRVGLESDYLSNVHPDDDDAAAFGALHKREMKRKWAKFFSGKAEAPYAIAFPALIRSRRHISQE